MDPVRYYTLAELQSLGNDSLLIVAQNLGLDYQVKQLIWNALVAKGMYEGSPYASIPAQNKYPQSKIMGMTPGNTLLFLNLIPELRPKVRELVISTLSITGRFREMPVIGRPVSPRLARPVSPRLARPVSPTLARPIIDRPVSPRLARPAYSWLDQVPAEYQGELVALINILTGNIPIISSVIDNYFATYSYERILGICEALSKVTSDISIEIPEDTRRRLVALNQMLCNSEHFWEIKFRRDYPGIIDKPVDMTWKQQYEILEFDSVRLQYIVFRDDESLRNNIQGFPPWDPIETYKIPDVSEDDLQAHFRDFAENAIGLYNKYLETDEKISEVTRGNITSVIPQFKSQYMVHDDIYGNIALTDGKAYSLTRNQHLQTIYEAIKNLAPDYRTSYVSGVGDDYWGLIRNIGAGFPFYIQVDADNNTVYIYIEWIDFRNYFLKYWSVAGWLKPEQQKFVDLAMTVYIKLTFRPGML